MHSFILHTSIEHMCQTRSRYFLHISKSNGTTNPCPCGAYILGQHGQ